MFRLLGAFTLIVVLAGIDVRPVSAAESRLPEFLKKFEPGQIFPGANRFGPVEGNPPAAAAFGGDRLLGYVYLNADVVNSTGYSGKPINIVVGIDLNGKIVGLQLAEHHEPIVLVGIPPAKITAFLEGYIGHNFLETPPVNNAAPPVDIISGATVTVMVIADSLMRSAIRIARSRGLGTALAALAPAAPAAVKKINDAYNQSEDWNALLADGSIGRMSITLGEINDAFAKSGNAAAAEQPEQGPASDSFIDLYAALATVPSIGRSLLGDVGYNQLKQRLKPGQQAIIVAGKGRYSFKGSGYVRGGIFDRIQLVQGENSIRFHDRDHVRLGDIMAEGRAGISRDCPFYHSGDRELRSRSALAPQTSRTKGYWGQGQGVSDLRSQLRASRQISDRGEAGRHGCCAGGGRIRQWQTSGAVCRN